MTGLLRPGSTGAARPPPIGQIMPKGGAGSACTFPVVGLGASAGGLETFQRFFDAIPADSGMAFVLLQHLGPRHAGMMRELLSAHTPMPVVTATDGMPLKPDHIYLIPPGTCVALQEGALRLSKPRERHGVWDVPTAIEAVRAGAMDLIEKPIGHVALVAGIERALVTNGDALMLSQSRDAAALLVASLTMRQHQVMDLVLAGHPSKNIAADLGISQRTVDNHRAAIMKKTGSKSLPALIRLAIAAM